jgi:F-type H+-transporting ATPase subunit b
LKQRDAYQKKNAAFDQQRAALMRQATAEANTERQRLLDAARMAAEALRTKQQATWRSEEQRLHDEIIRRTREEVIAITRKVLADLADMTLEQRMIEVFVRRLQELDGAAKDRLVDALRTDSGPVRVRSVFDLSAAQQATLQQAIEALLSSTVTLRFETGPDLLSGIALSINGQKIVWSVTDYLQQLEQSLATFVTSQSAPDDAVATHVVALPKTGQPA